MTAILGIVEGTTPIAPFRTSIFEYITSSVSARYSLPLRVFFPRKSRGSISPSKCSVTIRGLMASVLSSNTDLRSSAVDKGTITVDGHFQGMAEKELTLQRLTSANHTANALWAAVIREPSQETGSGLSGTPDTVRRNSSRCRLANRDLGRARSDRARQWR